MPECRREIDECQLPQEIRWPLCRRGEYFVEVEKIINTYDHFLWPSIRKSSELQRLVLHRIWGEMNDLEIDTLLYGMELIDKIELEEQENNASQD